MSRPSLCFSGGVIFAVSFNNYAYQMCVSEAQSWGLTYQTSNPYNDTSYVHISFDPYTLKLSSACYKTDQSVSHMNVLVLLLVLFSFPLSLSASMQQSLKVFGTVGNG